jgi:hypothetical protein
MKMRAFVQERDLVGQDVAFCKGCHEELSEQILDNYKLMEKFDEGARFLEEFGWAEEDTCVLEGIDEAFALLAEIKG